MKKLTMPNRSVSVALSLAVLGAVAVGIQQGNQQQVSYAIPDGVVSDAFGLKNGFHYDDDGIYGSVGVNPARKHFYVSWSDLGGAKNHQAVSVGFTPTSIVSGITPYEFLVAGTNSTGKTRFIKYSFSPPALLADGTLADADLVSSQTLLTLPLLGGLGDVLGFRANVGNPGTYFVRFNSTGDVYLFNEVTKQLEGGVVASDDAGTGAPLVIPELANRHNRFITQSHLDHGYMYIFSSSWNPDEPNVYLLDGNKDGLLDGFIVVTGQADLIAHNLLDSSRYVSSN